MPTDNEPKRFVLIVEDDEDIASGIRVVLESSGYETATVYNGEDAKSFLWERKPDVMTLDINMPEVTGLELLDYFSGSGYLEGVKVLLISGEPADELIQGVVAGAGWVLEKPIDFFEVLKVVDELVAT